jgi:hypothetical protein
MNFKYGAPRDAITKIINKMSTDKATAARVGIKSRKHSVKDRYEWKKTLKKIKKHKKYQNLLKVIREIYEETEEFYGHGPQLHIGFYEAKPPEIDPKTGKEILRVGSEEFYSEGPVTPLEQMEVHIDVGAKKLGGSVIHALHLTAMEAAARLLSGPLGASMTKFYSLVSVPKDGKIVGARYHALTGEFGLNHTVMDKTSLKSVDAFAQYLKARCAHEFAHAYAGPHDEEFSIAREQLDGMAADYLKYLVRISEAVFGKHSELREVVVEKEKIVEVPVERVVEREVERQIEVLVNDPEQMELFAEQEIGGYGGTEQEIFLSPESQRQLRLWPSEDDRLATGWGSTERIDGAGRGVQQPPAQSSPDTREGRLRSRVHPAESSGVAEADLPDSFSNPPERRGLWRGVRNWLTPRRKLKTPDKMSKPWKKALKDTPQYSIHRLERPVVTHYTKKGEEPKTSMKVFLVSIPDNVDALLTDGKPEIVFSNVEEARGHNVNPERLKDWLQLYDANIKLKKGGDFWGKPNDGKLQGVTILFLTKGCQRVPTTIERVELGILPAHSRLESCYEGMCFVNYKRYTLYGQIENMEIRDLAMADPTKLDGWLKRANIAKLNDTPFIREGSGGDSSHAFATDAAESWLHHSPRRGIEVPTVFISSGYAPVTDERYGRLRPYSDQFVAHFSVSGWFTRNEIMMRLAEFQAARDAGIPAAVRVITNRDNLPNRYGKLVDMARNEEFLFNLLGSMRLMQAEILETPYHDDTVSRLLKEHRSTPSGEFENVCAETGRCMSCGVKCLVNKLLGGRYGKGKVFVPAQYSLERGKPPIETVRTITHVGAVEESPNDDWRKMKVGDDLVGQGIGLAEEGIAHDYIDLGEGRDFLEEQRGGDVTILHFIPDEPMGRVGLVGPFQISDQHSIERWREALINSGSAFIYVYGGIDEISGEKLGDLPGYTREDIDDVYGIIGTRYTRNVPQYQMVDAQDRFITRRVNNIRARLEEWSSDPEGAGIEPQRQAEVQGEAASFLIKHDMGIPFFDEYASWQGNQGLSEEELVNSYRRRYGKMRHLGVGDTRVSIGSKITQPRDIKIEGMYERLKQQALSVGGWVAVEEDGKLFKTSMPVTIGYGHPTPAYKKTATGDLIVKTETREKQAAGQQPDIEPFGVYMLHDTGNLPDDWQKGIITLRSPLVIKFNLIPGEAGYDENSWKANLVRAYGGMTGYDLRETMMAEGFDSIVAVGQTLDGKPMGVKEIVYFGPKPHYYHARAEDPRAKKVGLARVTVEDLQKVFPKQRLGIAEDGSIWVETKAGLTLQIRGVEEIEPNSYALNVAYGQSGLEAGEQILGEYNRGVIRLQKDAANRFTLAHESMHWLEDVGILDSKDVAILRGTIQRLYRQGKFEPTRDRDGNIIDLGGTEDRANFLAEQIFAEPSGALDKIVKKIREFIDQLVNLVMRTSGGVVRDIKTGQMYDKGMAAGHTVNVHALASKAGPIWTSQLKDWIIRVGPNRATPQEWIKTLQRATKKPQNFKQEELKWSGIIEWLEDQQDANLSLYGDRISKDIVVQWLSAHNIKVVDRTMVGGERERRLMLLGETPQAFEPDEFDIYLVGDTWHVDFQELGTPWGDWEDINPQELREMMGQPGVPILHEDQIVALENWQRTRQIFTTRHMDSTPQTPVPFQWSAETPIGNFQIERRVHYNDDLEIQRVEYVLYKDGSELWRDETYNVYSEEELERLLTTMIDEADENLQADFHFTEGDVGHGARHQQYTSPGSYENLPAQVHMRTTRSCFLKSLLLWRARRKS